MSEHEDIRELLSAYLDGELSPQDVQRVEAALEADAELAAELEQLRKTRQLVQSLPRERAGEDFVAKVLQAAARQGNTGGTETWRPAPLPNPWRRYLAAAALILFAVGLGIFFSFSLYEPVPQPSQVQEYALKTSDDMEGVEAVGDMARDLEDLRDIPAAKTKAEDRLEEFKTPEEPPLASVPRKAPPEVELASPDMYPIAKKGRSEVVARKGGAPHRSKRSSVAGKNGIAEKTAAPVGRDGYAFRKGDAIGKGGADLKRRGGPGRANEMPSGVFVGTQSTTTLVSNVAPTDNEVIYTDDLAAGQKQVEAVLVSNAIEITPPSQRQLQPSQANMISPWVGRRNEKRAEEPSSPPRELQYVVYGSASQLQRVRVQLERDVRAKQTVAQVRGNEANRVISKPGIGLPPANKQVQLTQRNERAARPVQTQSKFSPQTTSTKSGQYPLEIADGKDQTQHVTKKIPTTQQVLDESVARQSATQSAEMGLAQVDQDRAGHAAPQSQPQLQRHREGLISNQAMLITLKKVTPNRAEIHEQAEE